MSFWSCEGECGCDCGGIGANVSVELLRQKVASLAEDNWMFEAEEDGRGERD